MIRLSALFVFALAPILCTDAAAQSFQLHALDHSTSLLATQAANSSAVGDVNGDGTPDIVLARTGQNRLFHSNGFGVFVDATGSLPVDSSTSHTVILLDVDMDGDLDLVTGNATGTQRVTLHLNNGNGSFSDATASRLPALVAAAHVVLADVDTDGDPDLIVENGTINLFANNGSGNFSKTATTTVQVTTTTAVHATDLDGDRDLDLVISTPTGLQTFTRNPTGVFVDRTMAFVPTFAFSSLGRIASADLDGDGDQDLIVADDSTRGTPDHVLLNDGTGKLSVSSTPAIGAPTHDLLLVDVDEDGDVDLIRTATGNALTWLAVNSGGGVFSSANLRVEPSTTTSTQPMLAAADFDLDADLDVLVVDPNSLGRLYWNRHRHLHAPPPSVGTRWFLELSHRPGYSLSPALVALVLSARPQLPRLLIPPFGYLGIDPSTSVALPTVAVPPPQGTATTSTFVPANPGLRGLHLWIQSFQIPQSNPLAAHLTNTFRATIQ